MCLKRILDQSVLLMKENSSGHYPTCPQFSLGHRRTFYHFARKRMAVVATE
jgi:hypothetical protein